MLSPRPCRQTGLSLVELMVGIAIGLTVLAGASKLFADFLNGNRQMLLATRLNQELRSAADLIARDLRRAGYWENALAGVASGATAGADNLYGSISTAAGTMTWRRALDNDNAVAAGENFALRLQGGVLQMSRDDSGSWEDLTDSTATTITGFSITPSTRTVSLQEYCFSTGVAYPSLNIRSYDIEISAQAAGDATVRRTLRESVRVRSDEVTGSCPS